MAGSLCYSKQLPDYSDLDNDTGKRPGYKVFILERDGGVSLQMQEADSISCEATKYVFMNVDEAKELLDGLQEAIDKAALKQAKHKSRGKPITN